MCGLEKTILYIRISDNSIIAIMDPRRKAGIFMAYKNPVPTLANASIGRHNDVMEDYPMHENVYFAFIDVLGFKQAYFALRIS